MRKNKFNAIKTKVNGKTCDSKLEAAHYAKLLLAEQAGRITDLQFHPRFTLYVAGVKLGVFELDFSYVMDGVTHYIDSKGLYTPFSKWKHKHLEIQENIKVEIWYK